MSGAQRTVQEGTSGEAGRGVGKRQSSSGMGNTDSEDRGRGDRKVKREDTHWGRRPRPLSITPIAITGGARAEKRTWRSHRADSTEPRWGGAVHWLKRRKKRVKCL